MIALFHQVPTGTSNVTACLAMTVGITNKSQTHRTPKRVIVPQLKTLRTLAMDGLGKPRLAFVECARVWQMSREDVVVCAGTTAETVFAA